jgi:hypothetical protein
MINWKRTKIDGMPIYTAKCDYYEYEIRSWPYDESGNGRFQLCIDGYCKGNFKTLTEAKEITEKGWS